MASDPINNRTALLKSQLNEYTKTYITYDINNRVEYVYTVDNDALNGDPCVVTRYSYDGVTTRVVYSKEYESTLHTAWETF